jgi:nitrate/nitrite transporter NarK
MPVVWAILPMMLVNYAPAGAIRGLWIGPYLGDVFGLGTVQIGQATLVMGLAMILGTLVYGPLDRIMGTRKWVVLTGNALCAGALAVLALAVDANLYLSVALMAGIGFLSGSFPVIIAHGRGFFPPHLVGRGVTLLNLFGIGGAGLLQFASGRMHDTVSVGGDPAATYAALFWLFAIALVLGVAVYAFSRDNMD